MTLSRLQVRARLWSALRLDQSQVFFILLIIWTVIFLSQSEVNNEQISNGINLLISILIRYPEIGTASFDPEQNSLHLKFMLSAIPSEVDFSNTKQLLLNSIAAYTMLEGFLEATSEIQLHTYDQVAILNIVRDVYTISKPEIALLITLLRENFKDSLIIDYNDSLPEEDLRIQEEVIENMLINVKKHRMPHGLIGIRENGRILVFNK